MRLQRSSEPGTVPPCNVRDLPAPPGQHPATRLNGVLAWRRLWGHPHCQPSAGASEVTV